MTAPIQAKPRITSLAPQLLVDDLERSIRYYEKLGFIFADTWEGFTRSAASTDWNCT